MKEINSVAFYAQTKDKVTKQLEHGFIGKWTERRIRSARKEAIDLLKEHGYDVERCFAVIRLN